MDDIQEVIKRLFEATPGEDPNRQGIAETPARFAKAWGHWMSGYSIDPEALLKTFEDGADNYDELVMVCDIPVYSHCEHHLAPIFGRACVGYIPDGKIVGLSKLNRLVDAFSKRLQVQERLTAQVAQTIQDILTPKGVGVVLKCRHFCVESRGIAQHGTTTLTSSFKGELVSGPRRAEFLNFAKFETVI